MLRVNGFRVKGSIDFRACVFWGIRAFRILKAIGIAGFGALRVNGFRVKSGISCVSVFVT